MPSNEALNLAAIDKALKEHDERCEYPVREIRMNPFEVDRLGWDDYRGIPIVGDGDMGTGNFRLICDKPLLDPKDIEEEVTLAPPTTREPELEPA